MLICVHYFTTLCKVVRVFFLKINTEKRIPVQAGMTRLTRFPLTVSNPVQSVRVELFGFALSTCQDM